MQIFFTAPQFFFNLLLFLYTMSCQTWRCCHVYVRGLYVGPLFLRYGNAGSMLSRSNHMIGHHTTTTIYSSWEREREWKFKREREETKRDWM